MAFNLGGQIRALRETIHLTQGQLGQRLGVTATAVSHWERGRSQPPATEIPTIAKVLGVTICELYGVDEGHGAPPAPAERPGQRWARRLAEEVADMSEADQQFVRELADALNGYRTRLLAEEGAPEATESLTNPNIRSTT